MSNLPVSVLLPVHNGSRFLRASIESILQQSYRDFELIIINDGSTDGSKEIINSYNDDRIIYIENESNKGLIFSLNRGIETAKGELIARMDADDVAIPERLEVQKKYLDTHSGTAVVASTVIFIDEEGHKTGNWPLDIITTDPSAIRKTMIHENCIAHPSIMCRAELLKELKYNPKQKNVEDYDLWLRILNRGYVIDKINEPLLLYRVHKESVTSTKLRKRNFFLRHARMKEQFLLNESRQGPINRFTFSIAISMVGDLIKGIGKGIKNIFKK